MKNVNIVIVGIIFRIMCYLFKWLEILSRQKARREKNNSFNLKSTKFKKYIVPYRPTFTFSQSTCFSNLIEMRFVILLMALTFVHAFKEFKIITILFSILRPYKNQVLYVGFVKKKLLRDFTQ